MARARHLTLAIVLVLGVGCSSAQPISSPDTSQLCVAAGVLVIQINNFRSLGPDATVEEVQTSAQQVRAALLTLQSHAQVIGGTRLAQLDAAIMNLDNAARALPPNTTAQQAVAMLSDETEAVRSAWQAVGLQVECPELNNALSSPRSS
jgi:hypothetical protein